MSAVLAVALPALGGVFLVVAGRTLSVGAVWLVAMATSVATAAAALVAVVVRAEATVPWVPSLGLSLDVCVDGISGPLVALTALVGLLAVLLVRDDTPAGGSPSSFHGAIQLVVAGSLAAFVATNAIAFVVAMEVVLVPMWVLIARFGEGNSRRDRTDAAWRFLLYTVLGSMVLLVGVLSLVALAGTADLRELARVGAELPATTQILLAGVLTAGLAVKVPVVGLHTWLPAAHTTAPTAGSMLLAAVLLKLGTYGLVRLPVATLPEGFAAVAPYLAVLGSVGIVWAGLLCLVERHLKRLIAYSSVAHMGFVLLGIASGTRTGLQAALFANVAHGLISALLFVIVGALKCRWGILDLAQPHPALREVAPRLGLALMTGLAASLALPGLAGFWGEFLAVYAAWSPSADRPVGVLRVAAVLAAVGGAIAAAYALKVAGLVWSGDAPDQTADRTPDATGVETLVLASLGSLVVVLGVAPGVLLAVTGADVTSLLGGR